MQLLNVKHLKMRNKGYKDSNGIEEVARTKGGLESNNIEEIILY